jgi:D-beta-D-heptose 7-phosphate kinase/D-beta-D-heptose 1-phosphate adenosyltransferase
MLDSYLVGNSTRISPEAPVPVLLVSGNEFRVGGAGNVALNVAALGAATTIVSLVGKDKNASILRQMLVSGGVCADILECDGRETIVKMRVVSKRHQLIRIDYEGDYRDADAERVLLYIKRNIIKYNVLILSDYAKGSLRHVKEIIQVALSQGVDVLIDPKGYDYNRYKGATVITPNVHEFEEVCGKSLNNDEMAEKALRLIEELDVSAVLITKGDRGMTLVQRSGYVQHYPTLAREVYDVTGAGDTVIATIAAALGSGCELTKAVELSNAAAGVVVGKFGTATVNLAELRNFYARLTGSGYTKKIIESLHNMVDIVHEIQRRGEKVVVTNGCFDILHPGHVDYLEKARRLGDCLVVLVNDDESVSRLKGVERPINHLRHRQIMLASLECIDYVFHFSELTPENTLLQLEPDILVKGSDYEVNEISGGDHVIATGGRVEIIPLLEGYSSSSIIEKIRGK